MKNLLNFATAVLVFSLSSSSVFASPIVWNLVGSSSQLLSSTDTVISATGSISYGV